LLSCSFTEVTLDGVATYHWKTAKETLLIAVWSYARLIFVFLGLKYITDKINLTL